MTTTRIFILTLLAMAAFAGNSLLCRAALRGMTIDAASFTAIRIVSGAVVLWLILRLRGRSALNAGSWWSALALFIYAAAFSFAYLSLSAGTGALLLFAAVQATMILWGVRRRERLHVRQVAGLALAFMGLVLLLLPGIAAPPLGGSVLMLTAGVAWGAYSLRGKGVGDAAAATAGNFIRAVPMAVLAAVVLVPQAHADRAGVTYAIISGAITSGLGYVIWYAVLPALKAVSAASVQLSVPVLTAVAGIVFLGEAVSLRLIVAGLAVLGGIALVVLERRS
ncbi:MAG TPA: DMT family transporter [Chthoniobacterales bacterium]